MNSGMLEANEGETELVSSAQEIFPRDQFHKRSCRWDSKERRIEKSSIRSLLDLILKPTPIYIVGAVRFTLTPLNDRDDVDRLLFLAEPFGMAGQEDFELLRDNPHLIPLLWQRRINGKSPTICFFGHIERKDDGVGMVPCLRLNWAPQSTDVDERFDKNAPEREWVEVWIDINEPLDESYFAICRK